MSTYQSRTWWRRKDSSKCHLTSLESMGSTRASLFRWRTMTLGRSKLIWTLGLATVVSEKMSLQLRSVGRTSTTWHWRIRASFRIQWHQSPSQSTINQGNVHPKRRAVIRTSKVCKTTSDLKAHPATEYRRRKTSVTSTKWLRMPSSFRAPANMLSKKTWIRQAKWQKGKGPHPVTTSSKKRWRGFRRPKVREEDWSNHPRRR